MNMKRFAVAALVGGITMWVVGYLIWGLVFADFFAANTGSATGVIRDAILLWATALGTLSFAVLVTLAVNSADGSSVGEGFKIGATVGFLVWLSADFITYGVTNIWNQSAVLSSPWYWAGMASPALVRRESDRPASNLKSFSGVSTLFHIPLDQGGGVVC
jgi:hypothetical protein